ncbi:Rv2175c family DNA-binding protein [Arcanobacterium buesumense]|uniref:Rv2175c family DNA-binding protein n=1 Tax=Arcanobacterium buesumense TaxID=2722751 RepID=UPI001FFCF7C2|nr:Rv2175c family DNA-binding protein [Arcanobacterium buesumense]
MNNVCAYGEWLSIPEVADILNLQQRDVRAALDRHELIAVRRGQHNALAIHCEQLVEEDGKIQILPALHGTVVALHDAGFTDNEALDWLLRDEPELEMTPLAALHSGNIHAVRRIIIGLAF